MRGAYSEMYRELEEEEAKSKKEKEEREEAAQAKKKEKEETKAMQKEEEETKAQQTPKPKQPTYTESEKIMRESYATCCSHEVCLHERSVRAAAMRAPRHEALRDMLNAGASEQRDSVAADTDRHIIGCDTSRHALTYPRRPDTRA
jgi:Tfp pilus assembly protein PilV